MALQFGGELGGRFERKTEAGFVVHRGRFDSVLLGAARDAGVNVFQPVRIAGFTFDGSWKIQLDNGAQLESRTLAEATGRSRILPGRKTSTGTRTIALCGYWSGTRSAPANALVEAGESCWYWGAPFPGGLFSTMVSVDPQNGRPCHYPELLRGSVILERALAGSRCGPVSAHDATPYIADELIAAHWLKVGDAALSIDPLSSQGVQTAVGTALHAAVALNTALDVTDLMPGDEHIALEFYRNRIRHSAGVHAAFAGDFYRAQRKGTESGFWSARAGIPKPEPPVRRPIDLDSRVRLAQGAKFISTPVATDRYVIETRAVEIAGEVTAFVGGMRYADLADVLRTWREAREVVRIWTESMPREIAIELLQFSWTKGLIEIAPSSVSQ